MTNLIVMTARLVVVLLGLGFCCLPAKGVDYQPDDYKNLQAMLKQGYRIYQQGTNPTVPAVTSRLIQRGIHAKTVGVRKWDGLTKEYSTVEWFVLVPRRK